MKQRIHLFRASAVVAALTLSACGGDESNDSASTTDSPAAEEETNAPAGEMTITGATSREPAAGQSVTAVYGTVHNGLDTDVSIVGVSSPVTDNAQLHNTTIDDDGVASMAEVEEFVVPAGGSFAFESGGPHIMLMGIDSETYPSDLVEVTLEFDGADPLTFNAAVAQLAGSDMSMDDHDDMDMDQGAALTTDDLNFDALHTLNDELIEVVADYLDQLSRVEVPDESVEQLLALLTTLDEQLAAGDLEAASATATEAYALAHDINHH